MNSRGKVWIIPDEGQIIQPLFERDVQMGEEHVNKFQEFSDSYQLGFHFERDEYQEAPCRIAELGHMIVNSENSLGIIVFYLPEVITDRELEWFYQNEMMFERYSIIAAYTLRVENDKYNWEERIYGVDKIKREINRKYFQEKQSLKNK